MATIAASTATATKTTRTTAAAMLPTPTSTYGTGGVKFRVLRVVALAHVARRHRVVHQLLAHFIHRQPLELVRPGRMTFEAEQGASAQLLGPLGRDVDEQEPAGDLRGSSGALLGRVRGSVGVVMV